MPRRRRVSIFPALIHLHLSPSLYIASEPACLHPFLRPIVSS